MESTKLKVCITAVLAVSCASAVYAILRFKRRYRVSSEVLNYMDIQIVSDEAVCDEVVGEIRRRSLKLHAIGFDCEWVTDNGKRQAVALLQLSTLDGYCSLFRLNQMKIIPDDAKYLFEDYSVILNSSLDVRHLAQLSGHSAGGLASLSKSLLHIVLDKSWKVRCSDWEAEQLSERQVHYAAADAHVAIKIFGKLINDYKTKEHTFGWLFKNTNKENVIDLCNKYSDVTFKAKHNPQKVCEKWKKDKRTGNQLVNKRYSHATRSKPLYNNGILQAPDGELLCTCDSKKARWYVEKGLASVVDEGEGEAPLTVRLRFEPAGRSVGDVGRFYQIAKENKCVVCGNTDSYIRKNVVPREYRKYFPEVMKDHSSHDVVLLCARCHQRANALDLRPRLALAALCGAPLAARDHARPSEDAAHAKKIRSAARALLYKSQKHTLPAARRRELEETLLRHFPAHARLSRALLQEAAVAPDPTVNNNEESHGLKVVEYFLNHDGLLRLEEYWRDHFLESMEPKYMPALWSTKHNEERLRVRFEEGRLSENDLHLLGLTKWL
ncbi:exonuclease 3'-5' domain-containing protein 2-like isoform X2 [Choristoneura fumiferana]|uniref:exonuclease 3'-5' domain-containing protein 2-like isoform X2 n=1 Tax=Choristoneura fumiferana TaxID=7141 RepID=UPI003D1549B0